MKEAIDGKALVYCEGAFNTPDGKTAHGLVRFTERYDVVGVINSQYAGKDAGEVLDGRNYAIPIYKDLEEANKCLSRKANESIYFVMGLAPDGGRLPQAARETIKLALRHGYHVDSGLHDFLTKDASIVEIANRQNLKIRDIRKTPDRDDLHSFTGRIKEVTCPKIAILGTDSALGKRTTAWILVHGFREAGLKAEMIGTGQTAWLQGAKYSMILDSCINDFVAGELENAILEAWDNEKPDVMVIEGQGSLMNPAYPGGLEILAAGRPEYVIMQHAPKRVDYDGFPGYKIQSLNEQINAIEVVSSRKVIAVTLNHEHMDKSEILPACEAITKETGLPAFDVLEHGVDGLIKILMDAFKNIQT